MRARSPSGNSGSKLSAAEWRRKSGGLTAWTERSSRPCCSTRSRSPQPLLRRSSRASRGWRRQRALVSLGRMRVPEAIPAMAEGLESSSIETPAAAVRGLGRTGLPEAAFAILEPLMAGSLGVPNAPVQTALENCCRNWPSLLVPYLHGATDETRALLARVIGELATPEMDDDLLLLAGDPLAEVRASSARALAEARTGLALPALTELAGDSEWFVRLRAVAGLAT